ncbi:SYT1 protein, partial [Acromyrmex charruanus]
TAYDHDRYANHTELCSLKVLLKDIKKIFYSPEIHMFNYKMKSSYQYPLDIIFATINKIKTLFYRLNTNKVNDAKNHNSTSIISNNVFIVPYLNNIDKLGLKIGYKLVNKLDKFIKTGKDRMSYVGQTKRKLKTRIKEHRAEFGHILLAVSYLPTAERLTINIMKLRDIKFIPTGLSLNEFNPYVKVLMLNGKTGKKMKKKKTKYLRTIAQPEFNETLTFNLAVTQLDTVQFLVVLCSKVLPEGLPANTADASDSEDSVNSFKRSTSTFIGKVALGKGVRGSTERLHWFSVLQNPRKLVTVWHTLK